MIFLMSVDGTRTLSACDAGAVCLVDLSTNAFSRLDVLFSDAANRPLPAGTPSNTTKPCPSTYPSRSVAISRKRSFPPQK